MLNKNLMKLFKKINKFFTPTEWGIVHTQRCKMYKSALFGLIVNKVDGLAVFEVNKNNHTKIRAYITDGSDKQYLNPLYLYKQLNSPPDLFQYYHLIFKN